MACLYCGKELGPIQLLRDDEFCSPVHRKRYADRLGKVIGRISEAQPTPNKTADFRGKFEPFPGNRRPAAAEWMPIPLDRSQSTPRVPFSWPLEIAPILGEGFAPVSWPQASLPISHLYSKYSTEFPVFPQVIFDLDPPAAVSGLPDSSDFRATRDPAPPPPVESWMDIESNGGPRAVSIAIVPSETPLQPGAAATLPPFSLVASQTSGLIPHSGWLSRAPAPMSKSTAAAAAPAGVAGLSVHLPEFVLAPLRPAAPAPLCEWADPAPNPAATGLAPAAATYTIGSPLSMRMPEFPLAAHAVQLPACLDATALDVAPGVLPVMPRCGSGALASQPLTARDAQTPYFAMAVVEADLFDAVPEPARCGQTASIPEAEPAVRLLAPLAQDQNLQAAFDTLLPALPLFASAALVIAASPTWRESGRPQPTSGPAALRCEPDTFDLSPLPRPVHALCPPAPALSAGCPSSDAAALAPRVAECLAGPRTAGSATFPARALEAALPWIALDAAQCAAEPPAEMGAGQARPLAGAPVTAAAFGFRKAVQLPALAFSARNEFSIAGFGEPSPHALPPDPQEVNSNPAVLVPISWIRVQAPPTSGRRVIAHIPEPGFIPVDFYCQRAASAPARQAESVTPRIPLCNPPFVMRVASDRSDEILPLAPQEPPKAFPGEVFSFPEAKKRWKPSKAEKRFARIAACLLAAVWLWFGSQVINVPKTLQSMNRELPPSPSAPSGAASASSPSGAASRVAQSEPPAPVASGGAFARMRRAIANRAASEVTDTLHNGMEAWGSAAGAFAPGWSRSADGYTRLGQLALFQPSLNYTDYRLQFFSQIEDKGIGVAVRAKDARNYYAMKVKVVQAGLRPVISMVHYPVVDGKRSRPDERPLNVMVHRLPFEVSLDVKGNRITTLIDGEQVDSWTDDLPAKGALGFFTEAGERAKLYWMKVSRNQDWLGHICALVAAGGDTQTAELWGPGPAPDVPVPATPEHKHEVILSGAGFGLRRASARPLYQGRYQQWS